MFNPLAALVGLVGLAPISKVTAAVRPNPYAPNVPTQASIATSQAVGGRLRGGLSGQSGSEGDYAIDQSPSDNPLYQDLSAHAIVPSTFRPNLPPRYYTGPNETRPMWGGSQRARGSRPIRSQLVRPGDRTPAPRTVAGAYVATRPTSNRLYDAFEAE